MSEDTILTHDDGPDPDMMAAELALGLLDGDERGTALRRVLAEPGFAQAVEAWRMRFGHLFDIWPEVSPSSAVFARVERTIDAPLAAPVSLDRPNRLWPAATAVATAAAAALLAILVSRPEAPVPAPVTVPAASAPRTMLVAAIDPGAQGAPLSAVYDPATGGLRISAGALANANQSAELWIIGADATPHSLGLLRPHGASTLTIAATNRARIAAGATLAVSLETIGGSPTGKPQGPVVATGKLSQV
ncbi:anti-sigma factor [Sphingomonas sp. PB4P5]|uniref:anti-sigma factor n=1 Tax=Parasphingomonas puruogangriensis TaxID=3096155 RepID=UPI002FCBFD75